MGESSSRIHAPCQLLWTCGTDRQRLQMGRYPGKANSAFYLNYRKKQREQQQQSMVLARIWKLGA